MEASTSLGIDAAVLRDPREAETIWRALGTASTASVYQSPAFLLSWHDHVGGLAPLFVLVRRDGLPALLLPLGVGRFGPLRVARFLGGKHANFNLAIFDPALCTGCEHRIGEAIRRALWAAGIDALALANQPERWAGLASPLKALGRTQPSPSFGHAVTLGGDAEAVMRRILSKEHRRKLRQKRQMLDRIGAARFAEAADAATREAMLDAYFEQKARRFGRQGIADPFAAPEVRDWLRNLAGMPARDGTAPLRLFGLSIDGAYVAVWGVGIAGRRASGMITSFGGDEAVAKASPGDLLLEWLVRRLCDEGIARLDFGVGEARYKSVWSDERIDLFDTITGLTAAGKVYAIVLRAGMAAKRAIKRSPRLMALLARVRRLRS